MRVSVVVPLYNDQRFVEQALRSALEQGERDLEVVVCDDGSSDRSPALVAALAAADPRLRLVRNERNRGVAYTRNRALALARGHWVALLDADDFYLPGRLARLLDLAEAHGADLLADNFLVVDEHGRPRQSGLALAGHGPRTIAPDQYLRNAMPGPQRFDYGYLKPLLRREFLLEHRIAYHESAWCGQDFLFYGQCLLHGARFLVVDEPLYAYRKYPRPRDLARKLARIERNRQNNRLLAEQARALGRHDLEYLLARRDVLFGHAARYEALTAALAAGRPGRALAALGLDPDFWRYAARVGTGRLVNRLRHGRLRAPAPPPKEPPCPGPD